MLSRFLLGIAPPSRPAFSLFLVALISLALAGCGDETAGPSDNEFLDPFAMWTATGEVTYGQLYVTASWGQRANYTSYQSGGHVYTATNHDSLVSGGAMIASNLPMPEIVPGAYRDFRGEVNGPTFGAVTAWSIAGNSSTGIPPFTDSMYVPAELRITGPVLSIPAISRSQPLTITWNADANNESILILIDYRVDESRMRDSNLTMTPYRWKTITDDDGSYTVSPSDLAGLPAGGIVQITLARGTSKLSGTSSHPFHLYAYTVAEVFHAVAQ